MDHYALGWLHKQLYFNKNSIYRKNLTVTDLITRILIITLLN